MHLYYFIHYYFRESYYIICNQVTDMYQMFYGAESFNQELCSWGQNYDASTNYHSMFGSTACPHNTSTPSSKEEPWCHSCPIVSGCNISRNQKYSLSLSVSSNSPTCIFIHDACAALDLDVPKRSSVDQS